MYVIYFSTVLGISETNLMKDGNSILEIHSFNTHFKSHDQACNSALLECYSGERLWVECTTDNSAMTGRAGNGPRSIFSGYFLYPLL